MRRLPLASLSLLCGLVHAQSLWIQRQGTQPPARYIHGQAYDFVRARSVMFGGAGTAGVLGDTWEWDGFTWTQKMPATSPSARSGCMMAHDVLRRKTVLFGGSAGGAETWEWDGVNWQLIVTPTSPPSRTQGNMAYDFSRGRMVLFGGSPTTAETWEYDGTTWTKRTPAASPPGRCCAFLSYDVSRHVCVLFGGYSSALLDDTWEWDGVNWVQRNPVHKPQLRCCGSMAYDWGRGCTVLFGGAIGVASPDANDTWEWTGEDWVFRSPGQPPMARRASVLVFDVSRSTTVLFGGGVGQSGTPKLAETWEYAASAVAGYTSYGAGCAGSAGTPRLAPAPGYLPWVGELFSLQLTALPAAPARTPFLWLGVSRTSFSGIPLPFALDPLGMIGCSLHASAELLVPLANVSGVATWTAPIPNDPSLVGRALYAQGGVLDPAANPFGATVSDAGSMGIAAR